MAEPIPPPSPAQVAALRAILIPLTRVSGLIVVLGLIACATAFVNAVFNFAGGAFGWIPVLNRIIAAPLHKIQQHITDKLGAWEVGIDASMGGFFHSLTIAVDQLATGQAEAAWATMLLAKTLHGVHVAVKALPSRASIVGTNTRVVKITKVIVKRVDHVQKIAAHAAPRSIVANLRAVAGELDHVIEWDIPHLRTRSRAIENRLAKLYDSIRAEKKVLVGTAFAGAVAVALGRLGLGWLRCNSLKSMGKRLGCGGFGLLDELLAASFVSFAALDICDFAAAAESVAESFVPALMALVDVEDALVGCHGATAAPPLTFPTLHLPPKNLGLTLAA